MAILDQIKGAVSGALSNAVNTAKTRNTNQSVLGIDIGSSAIKVVQLRNEGGIAVLETYGELALGPYADLSIGQATNLPSNKLAEALTDLMREANVTTKKCGVAIPFASSLTTFLEMPKIDSKKQLEKMIPIEARKYIPVPIQEVQLDWFVIPEDEAQYFSVGKATNDAEKRKEKTHVLLVAIHNETLEMYRALLKTAKLEPEFFEIESFSSTRAVTKRGVSTLAIIDIGAALTKLYIIEYGIVKVTHTISRGSQDITIALAKAAGVSNHRAEELKRTIDLSIETQTSEELQHTARSSRATLEHVLTEVRRIILAYQKRHNKSVDEMILVGGGSTIQGVQGVAQAFFDVPVSLGDPFSKIQTPAFLEGVLKQAGPDFAVSVGLALRLLQDGS